MLIAHVSLTPQEGAVWAAAAAFREAGFESFCIAPESYDGGRTMATDYRCPPPPDAAERLARADVVFCHDGWAYRESWYPRGAATVAWYHSPPGRASRAAQADGWPWASDGGPAGRHYASASVLPLLVPLDHEWYRPADKPLDCVRIACRVEHRDALAGLCGGHGTPCETVVLDGLGLRQRLGVLAAAHVAVGDLAGRSCGLAELEALAAGCVVVADPDGLSAWNTQRATGGCGHPFEVAGAAAMRRTLERLAAMGPELLAHLGRRSRAWLLDAWQPAEMIERNFRPLMEEAIRKRSAISDRRQAG